MAKIGVLIINVGTPDQADTQSVRRYLKQFLSDPRVIDLPKFFRWCLLQFVILPFRSKQSAEAYQKIWLDGGSPLLVYSNALATALSTELGKDYQVELGMRYGKPTIDLALQRLENCERLLVLPLYPQYASASTGSAIEYCFKLLSKQWNIPAITVLPDFCNHSGFIDAYAQIIKEKIAGEKIDCLLFSYHGLPERHINKSQCQANCDRTDECPVISDTNRFCYRAQCYATSHSLAKAIGFTADQYHVSFQSRLGRTPWIKPYTDFLLPELYTKGVRNIAIVCPSFVIDCLETLEEIGIRARQQWQELGGETFILIPCLNADLRWIKALKNICMHG